jgi:aminoglycoside phosphotransferase (APT) family kinase protein
MPPAADMPAAEVDLDPALVRSLLEEQHPDLADLPLTPLAFGWDNAVLRLGDDLVVRLPRRSLAAALVGHEQRWLPSLAPSLPLPVPFPVRVGRPSAALGYPWSWSVCPWLPGDVAGRRPPDDLADAARVLGAFVRALHVPAPPDAPVNPYRGVPLSARDASLHDWLDRLADTLDPAPILARWTRHLETPAWRGAALWLHGDLHPANLLVHDGRLSAVIDFGDLTSGDPAGDLFVAWMLFPPAARAVFRDAAGDVDDDTWDRAEGWALLMALAYLANSADNPLITAIGHRTLAALGVAEAPTDYDV